MNDRIEKLTERSVEAAQMAKLKLYNDLSRRIGSGEQLKPTELKLFNQLDRLFTGSNGEEDEGPPEIFDNFDDAVEYLGVSKRTLSVHVKKGNIKQEPDGTFFKSELDKYLNKYGRKTQEEKTDPIEILIKKADLRWRVAKATREENLTQQLQGSLISRDEVEEEWATRVSVLCSGLEILSDRLPPLLKKKTQIQMYDIIRQEIWELRDTLCRAGKYCPAPKQEPKKEKKK